MADSVSLVAPKAVGDDPGQVRRPLIRIEGVGKIYQNGTVALADVKLDVRSGEFLSLLGPSGCGKSTLLRMIAGLGAPSSGVIDWPQARYDESGEPERSLGFVFQEPTLMPWATVFENVYLPLKLAGVSRRDAEPRIAEVVGMVGLEKFARHYPRELSGGMKMRVSIARAIAVKPRVLLMDEPFAALDEITRFKLNNDLLALWQAQKWTVIFVTHSVYESVYLSNRIAVMNARPGRIMTELAIDAPYPRSDAFRTSPVYNEFCRVTSAELKRTMTDLDER
jgi:NitT/TauT family transport system ATP-binding protein